MSETRPIRSRVSSLHYPNSRLRAIALSSSQTTTSTERCISMRKISLNLMRHGTSIKSTWVSQSKQAKEPYSPSIFSMDLPSMPLQQQANWHTARYHHSPTTPSIRTCNHSCFQNSCLFQTSQSYLLSRRVPCKARAWILSTSYSCPQLQPPAFRNSRWDSTTSTSSSSFSCYLLGLQSSSSENSSRANLHLGRTLLPCWSSGCFVGSRLLLRPRTFST